MSFIRENILKKKQLHILKPKVGAKKPLCGENKREFQKAVLQGKYLILIDNSSTELLKKLYSVSYTHLTLPTILLV